MIKHLILSAGLLSMTACGAVYTSPKVVNSEEVTVVPLSGAVVRQANASAYTPKSLPAAFNQVSGGGVSARSIATLPDPVQQPQIRDTKPQLNAPPAAPETPYTLGVGDVILLATPSATSLDALPGLLAAQTKRQGYTIQDDGAIAVPDVGRIIIGGQTLEEAEAAVFQKLVENQVDPTFSIEVAEFNSKRVSVGGSVVKPTLAPITLTSLNLQEALQLGGGPRTDAPESTTIRLYRDSKLYQIPLSDFRADPGLQKIRLVDGDSIYVDTDFRLDLAQSYFAEQIALTQAKATARSQALSELQAEVNLQKSRADEARSNFKDKLELGAIKRDYAYRAGEVSTQGRFELPFDNTASLADALYAEGGVLNQNGDLGQVYILRADKNANITAYHLDGGNAVNLLFATKMELRPDDIVFVAEQKITAWNRVISQVLPSLSSVAAANSIGN